MPKSNQNNSYMKKKYTPTCEHKLIRTDGIITCSNCHQTAISHLPNLPIQEHDRVDFME